MKTKLLKINPNVDVLTEYAKELQEAAEILKAGGLVAFPTETVYGLGGNALSAESAEKIYRAKGRPSDNPLIVHVAEVERVFDIAHVDERAERLMRAFCPSPLTCVLPKKNCIPSTVTGGRNTVAVRIPNHPVALALLKTCNLPIAAPSANLSGKPSPTLGEHVYNDLAGKVDIVIDGGSAGVGLESTVLDLTLQVPVILRPGAVTAEMLEPYLGEVITGGTKVGKREAPKAPGMKYKHYAPQGEVTLFKGDNLKKAFDNLNCKQKTTAVLATENILKEIECENTFSLGKDENDLENVAHNIFAALRYCDKIGAEIILCQSFPEIGIGYAIMNRLNKAAANEQEVHYDK